MNVAGTTMRTENVLVLAGLVHDDELSAKLERAITNDNPIVALTQDDRERIVAVLSPNAPGVLTELRDVLTVHLKHRNDRDRQQESRRLYQAQQQRRDAR